MFEIFKSYQFNQEKARAYGFVENSGVWIYSCQILQSDFVMTVSVVDGNLSFQVFDQETGDLYPHVQFIWKASEEVLSEMSVRLVWRFFTKFGRLVLMYRILSVLRLSES